MAPVDFELASHFSARTHHDAPYNLAGRTFAERGGTWAWLDIESSREHVYTDTINM